MPPQKPYLTWVKPLRGPSHLDQTATRTTSSGSDRQKIYIYISSGSDRHNDHLIWVRPPQKPYLTWVRPPQGPTHLDQTANNVSGGSDRHKDHISPASDRHKDHFTSEGPTHLGKIALYTTSPGSDHHKDHFTWVRLPQRPPHLDQTATRVSNLGQTPQRPPHLGETVA